MSKEKWSRNDVDNFSIFKGIVFTRVEKITDDYGQDKILFCVSDKHYFEMTHSQDCCEHVYIESVVGDLNDLVGEPILQAEEVIHEDQHYNTWESATYTFYKFATRKGYVDIRWVGTSNGYYSERVDVFEVKLSED